MQQQRQPLQAHTECDIQLTISDYTSNQFQSLRRAAAVYSVPRTTVRDRRAGRRSRRDCEPNSKRLTKLEEEAIVERILEQDLRGISPSKLLVQDMADRLLRARDAEPVGKNWVDNFVKRTPELQKRWTRPYDRQRAACEDAAVI